MKKRIDYISIILIMIIGFSFVFFLQPNKDAIEKKTMEVKVIGYIDNDYILEDYHHHLYYINGKDYNFNIGSRLLLEYTGLLDKNILTNILSYQVLNDITSNILPDNWQDNGIFSNYYVMAYNKLKKMSTMDKISQVLLVKYPSNGLNVLKNKQFGGYIFYENDFRNKTKKQVVNLMDSLQKVSKIPILTATDEEGGSVVRVSSNPNLVSSPFKSPQALYNEGGLPLIKADTIRKSEVLDDLGINVNLAPVVDVSEDPNDYIYPRTIGKNSIITADYAKEVIKASKNGKVSYVLKHFPGYSSNIDTHTWVSIDNRSLEEVNNDMLPFKEGIKEGAEAVLVSHNVVSAVDTTTPASLSLNIHNLLRDDLSFTGVIISDDLNMAALDNISNKYVKALTSGNDLLIVARYDDAINEIKDALNNQTLSEDLLDYHVFRILAWKYYKGLMFDEK